MHKALLFETSGQFMLHTEGVFDVVFAQGTAAPFSGSYRCEACGETVDRQQGYALPSMAAHHRQDLVSPWRMVLLTQTSCSAPHLAPAWIGCVAEDELAA
jgi:hypothetical protein